MGPPEPGSDPQCAATARHLAARSDLGTERPALTIVTNALNIATELVLRPHIRTVSLGGVARPSSYEVVGPLAHSVLQELWIDHLILGVDALDVEAGASCFHEDEAAINAVMVQRARQVTVVTTSNKLGQRTFARICETSALDRLVTDNSIPPEVTDAFRAHGTTVDIV
ncbi:DeoR/GlpR family DNA-binding transcription regulator [Nocardioides sp. LML1-1-1.1]|uniref:DeoR/GlpR family DNA-binding transcription regulator n=1 Tax=Nocardioides sp. LML1-1-1.1 TaxID=3135248 RepID=UPI00342CD168